VCITVPVVGQVMVRQSFERAAGSVPAAGGQRGWILIRHLLHLVLLGLDETELPSAALKTHKQQPMYNIVKVYEQFNTCNNCMYINGHLLRACSQLMTI